MLLSELKKLALGYVAGENPLTLYLLITNLQYDKLAELLNNNSNIWNSPCSASIIETMPINNKSLPMHKAYIYQGKEFSDKYINNLCIYASKVGIDISQLFIHIINNSNNVRVYAITLICTLKQFGRDDICAHLRKSYDISEDDLPAFPEAEIASASKVKLLVSKYEFPYLVSYLSDCTPSQETIEISADDVPYKILELIKNKFASMKYLDEVSTRKASLI